MDRFKFNYKNPLNVGASVAEQEKDFLQEHFVPTPINADVRNNRCTIIRGRKGSGKTAQRIVFEKEKRSKRIVSTIYPEAREIEAAYQYLTSATSSDFFATEMQTIWELSIYISIIRVTISSDELSEDLKARLRDVIEEINVHEDSASLEDSFSTSLLIISRLTNGKENSFLALRPILDKVRSVLLVVLRQAQLEVYALIDSLDDTRPNDVDVTDSSNVYRVYVEGLLNHFRSFVNKDQEGLGEFIFLKIFIPTDVFSWAVNRHQDHIESLCHDVRWNSELLNEMIKQRLRSNIPTRHRSRFEQDDDLIWNAFVPEYFSRSHLRYKSKNLKSREHIISSSVGRPRDLIRIILDIDVATKEARLEFPSSDIIRDVLVRSSVRLRDITVKEFEALLPETNDILSKFAGMPHIIPKNEFETLVGSATGQHHDVIFRACEILFNANIFGGCTDSFDGTEGVLGTRTLFSNSGIDFKTIWRFESFAVHEAFHHALQISQRS